MKTKTMPYLFQLVVLGGLSIEDALLLAKAKDLPNVPSLDVFREALIKAEFFDADGNSLIKRTPVTAIDHKVLLMKLGKSVSELARELREKFGGNAKSLRTMIDNMIYCRDYYPRYAMYLNTKYGFKFAPVAAKQSTRQLLKQAA